MSFQITDRVHNKVVTGSINTNGTIVRLFESQIGQKVHEPFKQADTALCLTTRLEYQRNVLVLDTSFIIRVSHLVSTGYVAKKPVQSNVAGAVRNALPYRTFGPISESIIREWRYENSAWCRSGTIIRFFMSASTGRNVVGNVRFFGSDTPLTCRSMYANASLTLLFRKGTYIQILFTCLRKSGLV